jgi:hypothetical protein
VAARSSRSRSYSAFGPGFGYPTQTLSIVYEHGYATDSPEYGVAREIACEAVVRVWVNSGSVVEERIGNEETVYAPRAAPGPPRGLMLTDDEKKLIRKTFSRVGLSSVSIGG